MSDGQKIPEYGFVRLKSILGPIGPIPVSKSTWWAGVLSGRYPEPVKLGPRITAWRVEDIRKLVEKHDGSSLEKDCSPIQPGNTGAGRHAK